MRFGPGLRIARSLALILPLGAAAARAEITFIVTPSLAPNRGEEGTDQSPSYPAWVANAIRAIETGRPAIGDIATDPTAYLAVSTVRPADVIATSDFASWRGQADPPPPFARETGTRLEFGLHILGNGARFTLSGLDIDATTTLPEDVPGNDFIFHGDLAFSPYLDRRVGLDYGPDRIKGTADDLVYRAGEDGALPIDELVYTGVFSSFDLDSSAPGATGQDKIAGLLAGVPGPFTVTALYTLHDAARTTVLGSASATVSVRAVPEPGSCLLLGAGLAPAFGAWRRRRPTSMTS